jgi:hypothetical protein
MPGPDAGGGGGGGGGDHHGGGGGGGANAGSGGGGGGGSGFVSGELFDVTTRVGGRVGDGLVTLTFTPGEPCGSAQTTSTIIVDPASSTTPTFLGTQETDAPDPPPAVTEPPQLPRTG